MKVMIVDDHEDMRRVLKNIVLLTINESVSFLECDSGQDAVATYREYMPDCVLMDLQLDDMTGFEATQLIQQQDARAKVIIVTGYDTPTFRRKSKELQTQGFVCKDRLADLHQLLQNIST